MVGRCTCCTPHSAQALSRTHLPSHPTLTVSLHMRPFTAAGLKLDTSRCMYSSSLSRRCQQGKRRKGKETWGSVQLDQAEAYGKQLHRTHGCRLMQVHAMQPATAVPRIPCIQPFQLRHTTPTTSQSAKRLMGMLLRAMRLEKVTP